MKEKIISDFFYYFLDMAFISAIGYLFYIFMGKILLPTDYGILMTIIALFIIISPLTALGFNEAIARFIPIISKEKIRSYIKFIFKRSILVTALASVLVFLLAEQIANIVYSNPLMIGPLQIFPFLLIVGTTALLTKGVLQGLKEFKLTLKIDLVAHSLRLIIPILLVYLGFGVIGGLIGWILCFFAISFVMIYLFNILPKGEKAKVGEDIYLYGASSALSASGIWLLIQTGVLLLSVFNLNLAGLFAVASVFGQMILFLPLALSGVILPHLSNFFKTKNFEKARRLVEICLKDTFIILFPFSLSIIFFSSPIIRYIYNPEYLAAKPFFLPFILGSLLLGLIFILLIPLYASRYPVTRLKLIWLAVFLNTILALILLNLIGPLGVAIAFLLTQIVILFILSFISYKKIKISFPKKTFNALPAVLIFFGSIYLIDKFYINFITAFIFLLISFGVYFALIYLFKALGKDDKILFEMLKQTKIFRRMGRYNGS